MTRALILIDIQESFRQQPSWADISTPDIVERANRLVDAARAADEPIVWVLHAAPGTGGPFDPEGGLVSLQPGLSRQPGDISVVKTSHNAFTTTNLAQHLVAAGVDGVRIAGIRTEQCVETTARVASDLGYDVELVIDACATHPLPVPGTARVLSADEVTERTVAALAGRFATITTVDEAVAG